MDKRMLDKIPTPLEGIDTVADVANQVFCTPARISRNVAGAISSMAGNLERDISQPRESGDTPPPPDVLIKPALDGVGHIISGVMDSVKGAVDGVVETGHGIQREIKQFTR